MIDFSKEELDKQDKPPILGSWNRIYGTVLMTLLITVSLLYWFKISY